jgi:hypothetical protein
MLRSGREGKHNNSQNGGLSMLDTACTELDIDSAISVTGVATDMASVYKDSSEEILSPNLVIAKGKPCVFMSLEGNQQ